MGEIGYLFNLVFTFPIFNGLMLLYNLFGDFALAIIVLTLIIKLVLFPLTLQQLKSMKATQALQPQMAEVKKKYGKDQQAQALAMQALYKEYGVNPVAGCLPLLIQLPVLYGLFNALNGVLRYTGPNPLEHINSLIYPFLPHFSKLPNVDLNWFTFLNPTWHFSLSQSDPTHILPILAGIATFVQLRMSQPKTTATTAAVNDPSTQSMKTMQYVMPFVTVFFGWTFAAGLALYWTISSIFQAVQQYFVTGWGALMVTPTLTSKASRPTSERDFAKESRERQARLSSKGVDSRDQAKLANASDVEVTEETDERDGPIGSQLRTVPRPAANGSSSARRRPSGSSSARRRSSNNIQKRNVSRR